MFNEEAMELPGSRKTRVANATVLQRRTEHLAQLEHDRDKLLESYADLKPEALDALGSEERHRAYRMIGLDMHLAPDSSRSAETL